LVQCCIDMCKMGPDPSLKGQTWREINTKNMGHDVAAVTA